MEDLLFLAHRIPYPPNKGDKIRSFHILRHLTRSYRVHLGAFVDDPRDMKYREKLDTICASTCLVPLSSIQAKLRSLPALLQNRALSIPYFYDRRLRAWVNTQLGSGKLRGVFVFSSPMAQYVQGKNTQNIRRVADFVDVDSDKWRQYAQRKYWPFNWLYRREGNRLLQFERDVAASFDASIFVSSSEAALFKELAPEVADRVGYLDNGVDAEYFSPERSYKNPYVEESSVLVFTGAMDYWANIDAVRWFAQDIFPGIRKLVPSARFVIVGARPAREVRCLASVPGVDITGAVPDTRPYLAHSHAVVAPLRIARGVQNKVLEAMSMAKVVIATTAAVEGIEFTNPDVLQVADNEQQLMEQVIHVLLQDNPAVAQVSRDWVCQRYSWDKNLSRIDKLLGPLVKDQSGIPLGDKSSEQGISHDL